MSDFKLNIYRIGESGMRKAFGELETEIMELCWLMGTVRVRDVYDTLVNANRRLAYTTVMTVMSRLAGKGILRKERVGKHCVYAPVVDRSEFQHSMYTAIIVGIKNDLGNDALAFFVERLVDNDESLDELERIIRDRRLS